MEINLIILMENCKAKHSRKSHQVEKIRLPGVGSTGVLFYEQVHNTDDFVCVSFCMGNKICPTSSFVYEYFVLYQ